MLFGIAVVALLLGAGLVWALMRGSVAAAGALARSESAAQLAALQATAEAAEREKATLRGQAAQFESLLDARRSDISQLRQELGKAQAEASDMWSRLAAAEAGSLKAKLYGLGKRVLESVSAEERLMRGIPKKIDKVRCCVQAVCVVCVGVCCACARACVCRVCGACKVVLLLALMHADAHARNHLALHFTLTLPAKHTRTHAHTHNPLNLGPRSSSTTRAA